MIDGRAVCWVSEDMFVDKGVFFSVLVKKRWEVRGDRCGTGGKGCISWSFGEIEVVLGCIRLK
jgi:hypothetical protein